MRVIYLCLCFLLLLPVSAVAGCLVSSNKLTPVVPDVPTDSGGIISSNWHTQTMVLACTNMYKGTYVNETTVQGVPAGASIMFEGRAYDLYKTDQEGLFYFGASAVDSEPERNFSNTSYETIRKVWFESEDFTMRTLVKIRFYGSHRVIPSGVHSVGAMDLIKGNISSLNGYKGVWTMRAQPFSFVAKGTSCRLSTPANIKLRQVRISDIPTIGTSVTGGVFTLGLICNTAAPSFKVDYSMRDVHDAANISTYLTLSKSPSSATGIALQIFDGERAVNFDPSTKFMMGGLVSGVINKAMSVQYTRTDKAVMPGAVNAGVSVMFTYD